MLCCENCQDPRFLRITQSRTKHDNGERVVCIEEQLTCRECGLEGTATFDLENDLAMITGGLVHTEERPRMASTVTMCGGDA